MNTMTYKNYIARIEFDERDNIFVGRVLGLRSIISFHGETVSELRHEFEVAIDDFLNDFKEQGITPKYTTPYPQARPPVAAAAESPLHPCDTCAAPHALAGSLRGAARSLPVASCR